MSGLERTGQPGPREDVGSAAESHLHPPHVPGQEEDAPLQASTRAPNAVPPLPANASGHDTMPPGRGGHTQSAESAYEGRPEEDLRHEPGDR